MQKLLIICGPTATGKTSLGIRLAKKFNGEIVSADSRQVYKNMDIGTGKDIPEHAKLKLLNAKLGYYKIEGVKVYGYDLVSPKDDFSVSQYLKNATAAINKINESGKLPILVGGTGLYIKGVVDGIPTIDIPRNPDLRNLLSKKSAADLYESLSQLDSVKSASLNSSDKKNPRRLIRALEIAQYSIDHPEPKSLTGTLPVDTLFIGLTAPGDFLDANINKRVDLRVEKGFTEEVKKLLDSGVDWTDQSMMSLGYRQWRDYMEGAIDIETAISEWKKEERKYSRRQMVWWRPDKRLQWFDLTDPNYVKKVENKIEIWYSKT